MTTSIQDQLVEYFSDKLFESLFNDEAPFRSIVDARKRAESFLGEDVTAGTLRAKAVEEALEGGIVRAARKIAAHASSPQEAYDLCVRLYQRQPALNTRTSTSVWQQAYSTPVPIAYLASTLAGIDRNASVYEPTAGNGALLVGTSPDNATANELNPDRAAALRSLGYSVTERDATTYIPDKQHDVVVMNPPFGSLPNESGQPQSFDTGYYRTNQLDRAIALNALKAMKPDGRAVLILGGQLGDDEAKRSDRYNSAASRAFYYTLYNHYNVTDHFSLWGDLYRKQGAAFPVDVIVIDGVGKSQRPLPAIDVPRIYKSFDELGGFLNEFLLSQPQPLDARRRDESARSNHPGGRDRNRQRADVPDLSGATSGLAARTVDGGDASEPEGRRTDARPDDKPTVSRSIDPDNFRPRDRGDPAATPMATGVGRSPRLSQRHRTREVGLTRHRVSRDSDNQQLGERIAAMDVRQQRDNGTEFGRMVERSDGSPAGRLDVGRTGLDLASGGGQLDAASDPEGIVERFDGSPAERLDTASDPEGIVERSDRSPTTQLDVSSDSGKSNAAPDPEGMVERSDGSPAAILDVTPGRTRPDLASDSRRPDVSSDPGKLDVASDPEEIVERSDGSPTGRLDVASGQTRLDRVSDSRRPDVSSDPKQLDAASDPEEIVDRSDSLPATGIDVASSGRTEPDIASGRGEAVPNPTKPEATSGSQVSYRSHSQGRSVGSLVPVNMQTAIDRSLDKLEREVGSVDEYVTHRLQYDSIEELHQYFSAEQVDALISAIVNIERGSGFVLGDQTGIGKGRVVAGIIRYAKLNDKTPIFVTKDPALYADMIRDTTDINLPGFNPFVTNRGLKPIPLPDGRILQTSTQNHPREMVQMQQSGTLGSYDGIFTTYSQMQTVKGRETPRREFLRQFAPGSIVILDESHEAGGDASQRRNSSAAPNRADFARELTDLADGVLYSSATYAKRPDVMDLYHRTNMRAALPSMTQLSGLVQQGGIPLQQALATTLTHDGQYIRRERSFEGTSFTSQEVSVDKQSAEKIASIMRRITEFDNLKQQSVKALDKAFKAEAKAVLGDSSIGQAGVSSTNFTSVMHNLVGQTLLALKAEATARKAIEALQNGEKPVIALSNTMGSFLGEYAEQQDLQPGDVLDADLGDLLHRYLERSREILVGSPYGKKERRRLSDRELGPEGVAEYNAISQLIDEMDFSQIPISPIDYISQKLSQAGYSIREITGREHIVEYTPDGTALYQRRSGSERSKTAAIEHVRDFNSGKVDAIVLNRSGSTGISLHASEKFADRRRRHLLIAQPELDINLFMQTLGRVHRTGQVVPPKFSLMVADIPAEKRPSAVLAKKMASLNANTTAARNSGASLAEIPDFFNEYGERVVADLMAAYPTVHEQLGFPLKPAENGLETEDAVRKVTGRLPLLPLAQQAQIYDSIESEYRDLVAQQEALGESTLEAQSLDLDARPIARMEVQPADPNSTSPFTDAVYLEVVDAKTQRKPYTTRQATNKVRHSLGLPPLKRLPEDCDYSELQTLGTQKTQALLASLDERVEKYKAHLQDTLKPAAFERAVRNLEYQLPTVKQALAEFPVGTPVKLRTNRSDRTLFGVVGRVRTLGSQGQGNPAAPSSWKMQFLLADGAREITVPLSQLNAGGENSIVATPFGDADLAFRLFNQHRGRAREERQILTGNLLRAFQKFPHTQAINYTDYLGNIRTGLLTQQGFDIEKALQVQPVQMRSAAEAATVLREEIGSGSLQTADRLLAVRSRFGGGEYVLQTPKAKAVGGKYFLDAKLLAATDSEFVSVGKRMECRFSAERLEPVLNAIYENHGMLAAFEDLERVRERLGMALPTLEKVEVPPPPVREVRSVRSVPAKTATPMPPPSARMDTATSPQPVLTDAVTAIQPRPIRTDTARSPQLQPTRTNAVSSQPQPDRMEIATQPQSQLDRTRVATPQPKPDRTETAIQLPPTQTETVPPQSTSPSRKSTPSSEEIEGNPHPQMPKEPIAATQKPAPQPISEAVSPLETAPTSLDRLRDWYRAARDLNLGREKLDRIRQLGFDAKKLGADKELHVATDSLAAMERDLERYRQFQERGQAVAQAASAVLQLTGKSAGEGSRTFRGKTYHMTETPHSLTVLRVESGQPTKILEVKDGKLERTQVTAEDCRTFLDGLKRLKGLEVEKTQAQR